VDDSARVTMKNVAKYVNWWELQNPVTHLSFECTLRPLISS